MGVFVNMPITILQFLGNNKAIVLVSGKIYIPTSNAPGGYHTNVNLPKTVIMLAAWCSNGYLWYPENIVDTIMTVGFNNSWYYIEDALGLSIDKIRISIYQSDAVAKIATRAYYILGVIDL